MISYRLVPVAVLFLWQCSAPAAFAYLDPCAAFHVGCPSSAGSTFGNNTSAPSSAGSTSPTVSPSSSASSSFSLPFMFDGTSSVAAPSPSSNNASSDASLYPTPVNPSSAPLHPGAPLAPSGVGTDLAILFLVAAGSATLWYASRMTHGSSRKS